MVKKENIIAVLLAAFLSIIFVVWINRIEYLRADINIKKTEKIDADFLIEKSESNLKLLSNRNFDNVQSLIFKIIYNPQTTKFNIIGKNYSITDIEDNIKEIMLVINWKIEKWEEIVKFEINWWHFNISDISILFNDWKYEKDFIFLVK